MKERILEWIDTIAASPHPGLWLFLMAFAESSFFPIPPDLLLITLGVAAPERALVFGIVCTAGSVLGGGAGYLIGLYGGRPLVYRFFKEEKVHAVERLYDRYNAWATGIAGLTPIPYKIFTITGGAFKINFRTFMIASLASRGLRFMAEGVLLYFLGDAIRDFLLHRFDLIAIVFVVLLVGGFWFVQRLGRRAASRHPSATPQNDVDSVLETVGEGEAPEAES